MELPFTPDDYPADPEGTQPEMQENLNLKPKSAPKQPNLNETTARAGSRARTATRA